MLIHVSISASNPIDDISRFIAENKYSDAVELSKAHAKRLGNETLKLILELNELENIAPVEILERREKEIIDRLNKE